MTSNTVPATVLAGMMSVSQALAATSEPQTMSVRERVAATSEPQPGSPSQTKLFAANQSPLPPGNAASMEQAQRIGRPLLLWTLGGVAIITGVILLSKGSSTSSTSP